MRSCPAWMSPTWLRSANSTDRTCRSLSSRRLTTPPLFNVLLPLGLRVFCWRTSPHHAHRSHRHCPWWPHLCEYPSGAPTCGAEPVYGTHPTEKSVAELVRQRLSNKEIAHKLHLAEGTVKNYISALLRKTRMPDRIQLALYFHGWLKSNRLQLYFLVQRNAYFEAYSVARKTHLHQQVENQKNMPSNLVFLTYKN